MESLKLLISFRQNEAELYNLICSHSSKSGYVKDVLKQALKDELSEKIIATPTE